MAKLRVFISSTCYDLAVLRSELRPFISGMGFEPVMSEYSDVLYDPRAHTHDSCLKEIQECDIVVLIIGSRFGGEAVPSAFNNIDIEALKAMSNKGSILDKKDNLSITQLEVLKAIESSVPVYAFVEERVLHDRHVYEKNKDKKDIIDKIEFPSLQKSETAIYIFEFINFLNHRITNNSVQSFSRLDDIRTHLASQWSQLFQRLLLDSRTQVIEERRYRDFSERIEDLKTIVLTSLVTPDLRSTAKGAIRYRHLILFVSNLQFINAREVLLSDKSWDDIIKSDGIVEILSANDDDNRTMRGEVILVRHDETFYTCRLPRRALEEFKIDWLTFQGLEQKEKEAIIDALLEDRESRRFGPLRFVEKRNNENRFSQESLPQLEAIGGSSTTISADQ